MAFLAGLGIIFCVLIALGTVWGVIHFVENYKVLWELVDRHDRRIKDLTDELQVLNDTMIQWKTQRGN